ncbi:MAG: hypothetical protein ACKVS8_09220 [Phycisphaerales bacterium]
MAAALALVSVWCAGQARAAQPASERPEGTTRAAAPLPAPADAMLAYRTIRTWLDGWGLPSAPQPGELPEAVGAIVMLRYEGQLIGRGTDMATDASQAASDRDAPASRSVFRALQSAFAEADRRLPVAHDATRAGLLAKAGQRVLLSLELAGVATPVDVPTFAQLDLALAPGIDGVFVRQGTRVAAMSPAAMLAANLTPSEAARALVSQVSGDAVLALQELEALRSRSRVVVSRFRVVHLAQTMPESEPAFLSRGHETVDIAQINAGVLGAMVEGLVLHLAARLHADDEPFGLRGAYLPWAGRFEPAFAPPHEQALAALALARAAGTRGISERVATQAAAACQGLLHDLADVTIEERAPWDEPAAAALTLLALGESRGDPDGVEVWRADLRARCRERLARAFDDKTGFASDTEGVEGLIALALVREGVATGPRAVAVGFERTAPPRLVAQMPWLGLAAMEVAPTGAPLNADWAARLRTMRTELWANQVQAHAADTEMGDMAGGIVFSSAARALPTWQCLRPLAFAAAAWTDPMLTLEADRAAELARLLWAARYARQLQALPPTAWIALAPELARGGVRAAMWDQTQPNDASSMGLLFACEMVRAVGVGR